MSARSFRDATRSNISRQYADPFNSRPERAIKIEVAPVPEPRPAKLSFFADGEGLTIRIGQATIRQSWKASA